MADPEPESAWDNIVDDWYDKALASGQGFKSDAERQAYLDEMGDPLDHPMFATTTEQMERHPMTEAFRQLKHEDKSQYELCLLYKEEGNDFMKKVGPKTGKEEKTKEYHNALARYTYAMTFIDPAIQELEQQSKVKLATNTDRGPDLYKNDVEEIKSQSVLAFEEEQDKLLKRINAEKQREDDLYAEFDKARLEPGHEKGSKPISTPVDSKSSIASNTSNTPSSSSSSTSGSTEKEKSENSGDKVLEYSDIVSNRGKELERLAEGLTGQMVTMEVLQQTRSQLLSNRAMINLNLKNYNMCIKDCELSLHYWKGNTKAHYRKCKALSSLFKYDLALECYDQAKKSLGITNTDDAKKDLDLSSLADTDKKAFGELTKLYDQCNALVRKREADRLKVVIAKEKRKQDLADIYSALVSAPYYVSLGAPPGTSSDRKNRAIDSNTSKYFEEDDDEDAADTRRARKAATASQYVCRGVHTSSIDADVRIFSLADRKYLAQLQHSTPFFSDDRSELLFPVVFLYPQHNQLDIVQAAEAGQMLAAHLAEMFPEVEQKGQPTPVPWDTNNEFTVSKLMCYIHMNGAAERVQTQDQWLDYYVDDEVGGIKPKTVHGSGSGNGSGGSSDREEYAVDAFCQLHVGCTLLQVMQAKGHLVPGGLLHILTFVKGNAAHKKFLQSSRKNRSKMYSLLPNGEVKQQV